MPKYHYGQKQTNHHHHCNLNCTSTLLDCLNSVARQTYTHREHGVVDGASTDGTVDIINQHANQIATFITESDKGFTTP
jgi:glycosyltransferase